MIVQSFSKPFSEQNRILIHPKNLFIQRAYIRNIEKLCMIVIGCQSQFSYCKKNNKKKQFTIININSDKLKFRINSINKKSQMRILKYNTMVHASVEKYLRMGKYMGKIISLSDFYLPMFEEKLNEYKLPKELKYLPIVESNLNPTITSKSGAKGIWQFMPKTGKIYNLNIFRNIDDRNDPVKSTIAACRYLKFLYKKIKNWELVLAAYNSGIKNIYKILKNHNKKDFWILLNFFSKETQNYIPNFIAINYIMNYYKEHKIPVFNYYCHKYKYKETILIPIKEQISMRFFSYSLNISHQDLFFLNPKYIIFKLIPYKKRLFLRLPKQKKNYMIKKKFNWNNKKH